MTKRQQVMDNLSTLLNSVPGIAGRAYPWRLSPLENGTAASALFSDEDGKAEIIAGGVLMHTLTIAIDIANKGDEVEMRDLAQEVLTALGVDATLGGLLDSCNFTEFAMGASQMNEDVFVGHLVLLLKYETPLWQI